MYTRQFVIHFSKYCFQEHHFCHVLLEHLRFHNLRGYVRDVLLAGDRQRCSHSSCVFPTSRQFTTPIAALASVLSTLSKVTPTSAAKLLSRMLLLHLCSWPTPLHQTMKMPPTSAWSSCVLATPTVIDATPPEVLVLLDLQRAQSESVCTVSLVSNASSLNQCLIRWFPGPFKYFAILAFLLWSFFVPSHTARDISCALNGRCGLLLHPLFKK